MSVIDAILEWAGDRPEWQQDALRRLVATPQLVETDFAELVNLCKHPFGIAETESVPRPIAREDLRDPGQDRRTIKLLSVAEVNNANAIASDEPLAISDNGLTVVYGANGVGKSGYIRILKQVCRARGGRPPVLPNVYEAEGDEPASARLRYRIGDEEVEFAWTLDESGPDVLRLISIFDDECASVYIDEQCDVAFLPFGLDLLPRLAGVCNEVRQRLDQEIAALQAHAMALPAVPEGTEAAAILENLGRPNACELISEHATFSSDEQSRLEELNQQLSEHNPVRRAAELDARASRINNLLQDIDRALPQVSDAQVSIFREALHQQEIARRAVELASQEAFAKEPVKGTGGDPWRVLWDAARRFSNEVARVGKQYPPAEGEPCLLCQQDLSSEAADRLQRFEQFVHSEVEQIAEAASGEVERIRGRFMLEVSLSADSVRSDLEIEDPDLFDEVEKVTTELQVRLKAILTANDVEDLNDLPKMPDTGPVERLRTLQERLSEDASSQRAASKAQERLELERERNELEGKRRLAERREDLLLEARRQDTLRRLDSARRTTNTTGITRLNTELTEKFVTEALASTFQDELNQLRLQHLPIKVSGSRGERGTAYHQVQLKADRDLDIIPGKVLSTGEHRCVALAAFFAELSTQDETSTVIFDDPVSSLDHDRREYVARRLVDISQERPVVVFTHDIVFALTLQHIAESKRIPIQSARLIREGLRVGRVAEDLPWQGLPVRRRIGALKQMHQEASALHRRGNTEEYERRVKEIYGYLRETWERGVEEVLLNGAIQRFSPEVQTQRLRYLAAITDDHVATLTNGMSKSSRWLRGHDDAGAITDPIPEPEEVIEDIQALEDWRASLDRLHQGKG